VIDLVISDGLVTGIDGQVGASIAVDEGRIVAVGAAEAMPAARQRVDAAGRVVIPGAIDGHAHFCEDLSILAEPYESGTRAAAAGGATTVLLMPWDTPRLDSAEVLDYRKAYARGRAYVDYGFHATVTADTADQAAQNLPALWKAGIAGVKVLMVTDDPHFPSLDYGQLVDVLRIMAELDGLVIVHAENSAILAHNRERLVASHRVDPLAHEEFRSALAENEAVRRLTYFAEESGTRVVVAHMSTAEGVTHTQQARSRGARVFAEVCPRNLCLSTEDLERKGSWVKTGPPVRHPDEVEALWPLASSGGITHISSDHAAWSKENKLAGQDNIWQADGGIPQVQEMLPLMLDAVHKGRLSLPDVVRLTSYNPSEIYGLRPRKGMIAPGYDADLVIVEMDREATIDPAIVEAHVGYSVYEGQTLRGWPAMTFVRGELVMADGQIVGRPGHGTFTFRTAH
jgi:D-hydantoinase